ncbi:MAG TPA: flagellin [Sphingomonas sp.]|nr:flagellin [Sphingomonas sp.]
MAFSVNTNVGAMTALQSLNATTRALSTTQSRINSGMNVSSTKDDSASYTIAQDLRSNLSGLKAVTSSLNNAKSVTDVAIAGAEQISDVINQMKGLATQASDKGATDASRTAYNKDFEALRDQITTIVNSSDFNGANLLKTSGGSVSALQSLNSAGSGSGYTPDTLSVANQGMSLATSGASGKLTTSSSISSFSGATAMVTTLTKYQDELKGKLSTLGAASRKIDSQLSFTSKLSDVVEAGIGNLVDADLAKESAKLTALQTKQQLGVQALSIANQAPQTITSLFR